MTKKNKFNITFILFFLFVMYSVSMLGEDYFSRGTIVFMLLLVESFTSIVYYHVDRFMIDSKKIVILLTAIFLNPMFVIIGIALIYILPPIILSIFLKRQDDKKNILRKNEWLGALLIGLAINYLFKYPSVSNNVYICGLIISIGAFAYQLISKINCRNFAKNPNLFKKEIGFTDVMQSIYTITIVALSCEMLYKSAFIYIIAFLMLLRLLELSLHRIVMENIEWRHLLKDDLTGVFNKSYLRKELKRMIEVGSKFTLIMIDLNNFKAINDKFGHVVGDDILIYFSDIISGVVRKSDIYRYGGDEFCILIKSNSVKNNIIERLDLRLRQNPYNLNNEDVTLSASYGIVISKNSGMTVDSIIDIADKNMYKDKKARKL